MAEYSDWGVYMAPFYTVSAFKRNIKIHVNAATDSSNYE